MTKERAIELKDGTHVLVEAEVTRFYGAHRITERGNVALRIRQTDGGYTPANVSPEAIIGEKTSPHRRMFRKGDIVSRDGFPHYVEEDELYGFKVVLTCVDGSSIFVNGERLVLICAAENREDRKVGA